MISAYTPDHAPSLREVKAGAEARAESKLVEEYCMLICSLTHIWLPFLNRQVYLPVCGGTFVHQPTIQKNVPTDMSPGELGKAPNSMD